LLLVWSKFLGQKKNSISKKVWLKLDWYQLRYSNILKLWQMLQWQMLARHTSPKQLITITDGLYIQTSKFGWVLTSKSGDAAFYLLLNYRDPEHEHEEVNFAKPVVDIAASSRSWIWQAWLASWSCSLTENTKIGSQGACSDFCIPDLYLNRNSRSRLPVKGCMASHILTSPQCKTSCPSSKITQIGEKSMWAGIQIKGTYIYILS